MLPTMADSRSRPTARRLVGSSEGRARALEEDLVGGARFMVREPYAASDERRVIKPRIGNV
jgi:hypothetical protein